MERGEITRDEGEMSGGTRVHVPFERGRLLERHGIHGVNEGRHIPLRGSQCQRDTVEGWGGGKMRLLRGTLAEDARRRRWHHPRTRRGAWVGHTWNMLVHGLNHGVEGGTSLLEGPTTLRDLFFLSLS